MDKKSKPEVKKKVNNLSLIIAVLAVLLFISSASALYYYQQYSSLKTSSANGTSMQTQAMLSKLGKLIRLPSKETPSVAKIVNKSKLAKQPFFSNAQDGDWLVIYQKAGEAIIYRESINQVIAVGPVTTNGQTSAATSSSTSH